jgi:hypothetical protein
MVPDQLGHQRKAEPLAARLGGDERIEEMRPQILRDAAAIIGC